LECDGHPGERVSAEPRRRIRGEGLPVCRRVVPGLVVVSDTADDDRSDSPEHLQHLCCRCSQSHGHNLSAICGCVCDEDAPWDAFQDLRCEEDAIAFGEVEDEDEGVQEHEAANRCPPIADLRSDGAGDEDADEGAERSAALEG
jgi:hypothetical protein